MFTSTTRITGMMSGLDTDTLVKKMMDAESISLNKLKQQQLKETWRSDALRDLNKDLLSLQQSTLFDMKLSKSYNTFDVSSSMPNAVTAVGTASSFTGTYSVKVENIAKAATVTASNVVLDTAKTLGDVAQGDRQLDPTVKSTITLNSGTLSADIEIDPSVDTVSSVVSKINSAKDESGNSLGLRAFYDSTLKQFTIQTKATGSDANIEVIDPDGSFTKAFGQAIDPVDPTQGRMFENTGGVNAVIEFNGTRIEDIKTNNVTIMGVNLTLRSDTAGQESTLIVSQDVNAQVENIKGFVDKYNEILDKLNKLYSEPVYRDYQPLLDDERNELSEKQAELWEEKAKSGLLRNDGIVRDLLDGMRSAMSGMVGNGSSYNSLASIGIASQNWQDKGKLTINEDKLREAIQNDADGVRNLFSQSGDTLQGTNGLVHQVSDIVGRGIKNITAKAGSMGSANMDQSVIGKLLSNIQSNIDRQTDRLTNKENQYYKQFAAMEAAMAKYNSQSSWLYQQMG